MAAQANQSANQSSRSNPTENVAKTNGKPPYPFRTGISLLLLAGNFIVAAFYFKVLNP